MSEVLERIVRTREDAHRAANEAYRLAKAVVESGKAARIVAQADEADRSVQQNRYYWGVVLVEIAEQASIGGQRWTAEAWHELMKRQFLGYHITKVQVAGRRKKTVIRRLRSTTDLKVSPFNKYLEKVLAFAATDLGVRFSADWWE